MKMLLKLTGIIAIVAVIGFAFVACEEDSPTDVLVDVLDVLDGTTWMGNIPLGAATITFNRPNFSMSYVAEGQTVPYYSGTYVVSGNIVNFTTTTEFGDTGIFSGTITGDILTIGEGSSAVTFTKQ